MRLNLPPGRAGLIVFAAAAVPVIIKSAKPLVRRVGRGLVKLGEQMSREAEAPAPTEPPKAEPAAEPKPKRARARTPKPAAKRTTTRRRAPKKDA